MTTLPKTGSSLMTTLLTPSPEKQQEFLQTLRSLRGEIGRQPGCLACTVFQDDEGSGQLALITAWEDQASLLAHVGSEPFRVLVGAAQLLGASPEFRYSTTDRSPWAA
jgi:quinol monooxygenase YgiN